MTTSSLPIADRTGTAPLPATRGPRVLLAADESDGARAGEAWIRRLRWIRPPEVDVLTVAPAAGWASGLGLQTYRQAVRQAMVDARHVALLEAQRVANVVGSRLQESGFLVRVWACHGSAADEIVRMARLETADLIVIGHGGRAWRGLPWSHGVAYRVAHEADRSVLVAPASPPGYEASPRRIALMARDRPAADDSARWMATVGWIQEGDAALARVGGLEDAVGLAERGGADIVVWPRSDRRSVDEALSLADAARVTVLLVPHPRPASRSGDSSYPA